MSSQKLTWQRATMSKCWAKISTSLPLPSSPHWHPNTPETWPSDSIRLGDSLAVNVNDDDEAARGWNGRRTLGTRWGWRRGLGWAPHLGPVTGQEEQPSFSEVRLIMCTVYQNAVVKAKLFKVQRDNERLIENLSRGRGFDRVTRGGWNGKIELRICSVGMAWSWRQFGFRGWCAWERLCHSLVHSKDTQIGYGKKVVGGLYDR